MLLPLSENQKRIFRELCYFIEEMEYPPTIPELQERCKVNNPGTIHKTFRAFEKKGYITILKGSHRGIRLTQEAERKYLQ